MNEHPILFSTPMVKAILDGKKNQTRRVVKPQPVNDENVYYGPHWLFRETSPLSPINKYKKVMCPYGQPDDRLWARETWTGDENTGFAYKASEPDALPFGEECVFDKWKPSIHMPRSASRITLEVLSVRVERVQQISMKDCLKEGVGELPEHGRYFELGSHLVGTFAHLWNIINAKRGYPWEKNPWVWVIEFRKI